LPRSPPPPPVPPPPAVPAPPAARAVVGNRGGGDGQRALVDGDATPGSLTAGPARGPGDAIAAVAPGPRCRRHARQVAQPVAAPAAGAAGAALRHVAGDGAAGDQD